MIDQWVANVVAQLRILGVSQKEFAQLCGYSEPYMSQVLRGHKRTQQAQLKIQQTLDALKKQRKI